MSNDASSARGQTRREVLAALGAGAIGSALVSRAADASAADASAAAAGTTDWPQSNADAANSGYLPDGRGPTSGVGQGWTYNNDRYHDGLSVADGVAYVGGKSLAAVDAATGAEQWTFRPEEGEPEGDDEGNTPEFGTPAVADGRVYASVGFGVYDGTTPGDDLVAVDAATGAERWRFDPADSWDITDPTVADGTVYVRHKYRDGGREAGTTLYALSPEGGEPSIQWQQSLAYRRSRTPVCVGEGLVFAPGEDGVTALDAATGEVVWEALPQVSFNKGPPPVVAHGTLYVAETGNPGVTLVALDAATGEERWRRAFGNQENPQFSVGATDEDGIYVQWNGAEADVIALARDGSERWRTNVTAEGEYATVWTDGLARAGGLLFAGESALDPTDGSVVWKRPTDEPVVVGWRLAAVSEGRSYLVGEEAKALVGSDDAGTPTGTATGTPRQATTRTETTTRTRTAGSAPDDGVERTATPTPQSGRADGPPQTTRPGAGTPASTTNETGTATGTATSTAERASTITGTTGTSGPGFGALAGLAGLAGLAAAVAALARRRDDEE